ncbi:NmrA-like family protein-like protein [Lindgomyces ingoldianus]|uniref:NmrA-like family protein-like protein n=1 Tax=Lindgomyces ingoldianus TaxID=673940 RepID=A0ACB6QK67_9PLEO|nr:NmrA-like family protein-like protein [Lindgomyces ingoldianus]KAF2466915.1 NmrA-like family protein-like protein [Lindgomyces ingoldianus]
MVNLAVAGGTGNVATEILRSIIASNLHTITILTRKPISPPHANPALTYKVIDYNDVPSLVTVLTGFEVVLSFLVSQDQSGLRVQKNLIDACVQAGVKRFAPSEWGVKNGSGIPPYKPKDDIAEYLKELNKDKKVLEYTLVQPSLFLDYFAHPHPLPPSTSLHTWPFFIDFSSRHAIILDSGDQPIILTAISDISSIITLALSDPRPWPPVGGIRGTQTSINELIALGKKLRGGRWTIEYVNSEDLDATEGEGLGERLKTTWVPRMSHPIIPEGKREAYSRVFVTMFLQGIARGAWDVSGEWNERFPEYNFWSAEEYLTRAWEGKP